MRVRLWLAGFRPFPTLRTSTSSWAGDKLAFEQTLVDARVKWFVYVKFYVSCDGRNKTVPLVIGKSGSRLVNHNGSDLNFSVNVNDGPARRFLAKHRLSWNHDLIYVKKCRSEQEAYAIERKFKEKWDLYGS